MIPLGLASEIDPLIDQWRRLAGARPPSLQVAALRAEAGYRQDSRELRRRIWDPVMAAAGNARRLFVVPDGKLHLVGFSTLPMDDGSYLLEHGPLLHYLSTERDLVRHNRSDDRAGRGLLALGGPDFDRGASPTSSRTATHGVGATAGCAALADLHFESLPASIPEVIDLAKLWEAQTTVDRGGARVLTGDDATEEAVKLLAPGTRVVHLATHGFFAQDRCASFLDPDRESDAMVEPSGVSPLLLSGLALAGANRRLEPPHGEKVEDGILTAEEIASMDLSGVEWVVLSACETGVGEVQSGEGVLGLRRAFETAGAGTLIMSMWRVEDEATREWMSHLYGERLQGSSTAESVRRAGLAVIRARREAGLSTHPFNWGAFVAAGDWR
jgi:CHAT domain-containing protein